MPPPWPERASAIVAATNLAPAVEIFGRVEHVADGIALVSGLADARLDEVVRFGRGELGFVRSLEPDRVICVLLDPGERVTAGDIVRGTGDVVRTPVGPGLLGRVVDPLGRPLDDGPPIVAATRLPIDRPAPPIIARDLVNEPVQTGILTVDALFALGRGQRELIIGDRATGKTALATDIMIAQKSSDVVCIYAAVGTKTAGVAQVLAAVRAHGAPERCILVAAPAASPPGLQWIAPFAAMSMAEDIRDGGGSALVVIDDLTRHAATHRELALLTREPPGREAYPGDVFHLHARLLERAARLSAAEGGGSLTALPIAETDAGNLSANIPTNLISITDGQLVLSARLFEEGQKPAIDIGTSVSRVGGKTQAPALHDTTGTMRLDYAQFLELEIFARFGGLQDPRAREQLARGQRLRALLSQPQFTPLRLVDEVALAIALADGLLDPLPTGLVARFRAELPSWLDREAAAAAGSVARSRRLGAPDRAALHDAIGRLLAHMAAP
ncbi:F0F1 ATP synthase subunit alpha [Acidiphilium sp. JA12-A1]|uniref:F0F1 ATP synthase subunit alpha n=1 Tax=Acidiphilium sp. JA12-A1 TaxID=1464546 RepID=UPI000460D227|nr:F0F1 ATP synthase subunit alpha [Acidiphilium sp. JA12-A1]KDM65692.1 ATP synthase subunit alpha 3 [Acidiphilium sp. JA12-A1]